MKNTIHFVLLVLFSCAVVNSSAQKWQWGYVAGSNGRDDLRDLTTDTWGNTYLLADMELPTGIYSASTAIPKGKGTVNDHVLLVSHDCNGQYRWSKVFGGGGTAAKRVRVSPSGKVYVWLNVFTNAIYDGFFDEDTTVPGENWQAMSLVCYDTTGRFQWLRRPDTALMAGSSAYQQMDMDIDEDGNVYCLVSMPPGNKILGSGLMIPSAPPYRGSGAYVLKYNDAGTLLSVTMLKDISYTFKYAAFPSTARLTYNKFNRGWYLSCSGFSDPGNDSLFIKGSPVDHNIIFCSFAEDGVLQWHFTDTATTGGNIWILDKAQQDDSGNIFIAGTGCHNNMLNGHLFQNPHCRTPWGRFMPFIMKTDSNGVLKWCTQGGQITCSGFAEPNGFAINKKNGIAVIGISGMLKNFFGDPAKDTITVNKTKSGGPGVEGWYAIVNLSDGKTVKLGAARGEGYGDGLYAVASHNDDLFIAGSLESNPLTIDSSLIVTSKKTSTGQDIFVAKYGLVCGCAGPPRSSFTYSAGNFTFTGSTPVDSVIWDFGDGKTGKGITTTHSYTLEGKYEVCATVWTICGSSTYCETIDIPLTLKEAYNVRLAVSIYPNPANNALTIEGAETGTEVSIANLLGQYFYFPPVSSKNHRIELNALTNGVYILRLKAKDGETAITKILKRDE